MRLKKLTKDKVNKSVLKAFVKKDSFDEESSMDGSVGGSKKYKKHDLNNDDDDSDSSNSDSSDSSDDYKISKRKSKGLKLIYSPGIYNVPTIGLPIISPNVVTNVALWGMGLGFGTSFSTGTSVAYLG